MLLPYMRDGEAVDAQQVAGKATANFCPDCTEEVTAMLSRGESPLHEFDVEDVRFDYAADKAAELSALSGETHTNDDVRQEELNDQMVAEALTVLSMDKEERSRYVKKSDVRQAMVIHRALEKENE